MGKIFSRKVQVQNGSLRLDAANSFLLMTCIETGPAGETAVLSLKVAKSEVSELAQVFAEAASAMEGGELIGDEEIGDAMAMLRSTAPGKPSKPN